MSEFLLTLCLILLFGVFSGDAAAERGLLIAENGRSDYRIVIPENASPSVRYASEELQRFLQEMSDAELPIVTDEQPLTAHEILLGENRHLERIGIHPDFKKLGLEGYRLQTAGPRLVIAGSPLRGTLYGVYGLLEDHLGCRWFMPTVSRIPKLSTLRIEPFREEKIPTLEYREPYIIDGFDGDWAARNRMNGTGDRLTEKHGGKIVYGGFVHTFNDLVPPGKYFDTHPEYFSEVNGHRIKDHTQLCATNEDVIRIVTEEIRRRIREHPEATVFSVSQNDWFNPCTCDKCKALAEKEGTQAAPVLYLVNRVAEAIEKEYPDKIIDTLAYQWSRKPPKTMRPRPNVIVRLCSIECCFSHPLATCDSPENQAFRKDIEGWSRMSDRLWIWDYTTSFGHYYLPFPNLHSLDDNIRFFVKNHVTGIFEEDNYQSLNGNMSPLKAYMMAKFLWNPNYPREKVMTEFLEGVYGSAAGPIREWIDLLQDKVAKEDIHVRISARPNAAYLTDDLLARSNRLWEAAEGAVLDQPERLNRVRAARMSTDYALIERGRPKDATPAEREAARLAAERFFPVAERSGVTQLNEGGLTLADYRQRVTADLQ